MIYKEKYFLQGESMIEANQLQVGDVIALSNDKLFWIDDVDSSFINDEIGKLYDELPLDHEVKPKDSKYTIYSQDGYGDREISEIPHNAKFIVYRLLYEKKD